jgi:hypothetical protein
VELDFKSEDEPKDNEDGTCLRLQFDIIASCHLRLVPSIITSDTSGKSLGTGEGNAVQLVIAVLWRGRANWSLCELRRANCFLRLMGVLGASR